MGFAAEAAQQLRLALPATVTYLFGRSFVSICLIFIGRMGDLELAAAALANTTMNVSGLSVLVGMGTAVSTICGQAYGAKNYRKVGETLQLGLLVFCVLPAPLPPGCPLSPPHRPLTAAVSAMRQGRRASRSRCSGGTARGCSSSAARTPPSPPTPRATCAGSSPSSGSSPPRWL